MKIVLASINSKYIHSSLGVWYLHCAAKTAGTDHTVQVYESTINSHIEDIVADIYGLNPDVVGFSCYIWNIEYVKKITENLKKINPKLKIFFGGPEAGFDAQNLLDTTVVDLFIKGEGEQAFINLLQNDFTAKEKVIVAPVTEYFNPYSEEYFSALKGRIVYLETSRGCPFHCAFCLSGRDENVRFFDMDISKENIIKLANCGTQTVKFVDRTFNCNDKRARDIFEFIFEQRQLGNIPEDVVFHCEVEADLFTQETLDYLKTMPKGLFQFEAGLQSFNPETLKGVDRRHNVEHLVHNLKEIAQMKNIHLHIDLIAGLPYEDYDSFAKGF
ncbi:MAG: B12-binding domain-containing radical SAM protein, partial [Oscillospiraceae bacterium]|nr:B12-binding domain-containing radical SAM protein [Oscillospiraceae bacterium]